MSLARTLAAWGRTHFRNASWSSLEYLFYPLLMLLATPVLVRELGTAQFGLLMLVNSLAGLSGPASFGMSAATIKFVSASIGRNDGESAAEVIRATLWLSIAGGALVALVLCLAAPWLVHHVFQRMGAAPEVIEAIVFAAVMMVIMQIDGVFSSALKGMERFDTAARFEMSVKLLSVGAAVLVAWLSHHLLAVLATTIGFALLSAAAKAWAVKRLMGLDVLWPRLADRHTVRKVLRFGVWNWVTSIGAMLFVHADRLLIGSLLGAHALSYYSVCVQLAQQVHALPAAAMSFLFPLISRKIEAKDHASVARVRKWGVFVNVSISAALGTAMLLFGPWFLRLWMGADFAHQTGNILQWLTIAYFVLSLNVAPYYMLLGRDEARYVSVTNLAGGGIGVLAALLLITPLGLTGAAQARIVLGVTTLANYWKLYRERPAP